jgi:hypothetical protein
MPKATHWGELQIGDAMIPCYVLDTEERVFSLKVAHYRLIRRYERLPTFRTM